MKKLLSLALCLVLLLTLAGCAREVAVDVTGLQNLTSGGDATGTTGKDYTTTLTPAANYELPAAVTVTVDGEAITEGVTYDPATGALTIAGGSITGDIAISATAPESIVGVWAGQIDMSDYMNQSMAASDESMADYFNFTGLTLDLTMTFTAEGTCSLVVDPESVTAMMEAVKEETKSGTIKMLQDVLAAQGVTMSVEEYLALAGMDLDALMDAAMGEAVTDEMLAELEEQGNYTVRDGKLFMLDEFSSEINEEDFNLYTIENGVLTIQASESDADETYADFMFPLVLTRVPA